MKTIRFLASVTLFLLPGMLVLTSCIKKNTPPTVNNVTVNPATVDAGASASITVSASDIDGDPLAYAYAVTGGAIIGTGSNVQWVAPTAAGAHSVTVTVTDGNGGSAIGTGALMVKEIVKETKITGTASFPAGVNGDLVNAKVSIYTSLENWNANSPIRYTAVTGSGSSVTFALNDVLPGNYYLDVWKDNDNDAVWSAGDFIGWYGSGGLGSPMLTELQIVEGQTANVAVSMYIIANNPPVIANLTVNPVKVQKGQTAAISVTATDPDNDPLTYTYQVSGGSIQGTGANVQWIAPNTPGNYTVTVTVQDNNGGSVTATGTLEVAKETKLTGTAAFAAGTTGNLANAVVSLYASLNDWNNNVAVRSMAASGSGNSVTFAMEDINPGTYYLDVWKDNDNNQLWSIGDYVGWYGTGGLAAPMLSQLVVEAETTTNIAVQMFIIQNGAPVIQSVTLNPSRVNVREPVSVSVVASDPDRDPLTYAYQVTGGSIQGTGAEVTWTAPSTAGNFTITVTVTDSRGAQATASSTLEVTAISTGATITGTARFAAGINGNLSNSLVSIYTNYDNWVNNKPHQTVRVSGSGNSVTFIMQDIQPGVYFLDVWKDVNSDGLWTTGDYVGWYGTDDTIVQFSLIDGQTRDFQITMVIL